MELFEAIRTRRSVKKLVEPAPSPADIHKMLEAAVMAPDHKELSPWRFIIIEGEGLNAFGDVMAESLRLRDAEATQGQLEKEKSKPLRAPMIIVVSAAQVETRLAFSELISATDAATQNLLLAAHGLGYGAIWRTGAATRDTHVKKCLGLQPEDEIVALVYIGTPSEQPEPRQPKLDGLVTSWPAPIV